VTRPRIGVTLAHDADQVHLTLRREYVHSVEKAGGFAVALPTLTEQEIPDVLGLVDGLLLVGGSDIDPELYGALPHPKLDRVSRSRDTFELALCREAFSRNVPILGICRGLQVLNVALGGTLVQDIPSEVGGGVRHDAPVERWERLHEVEVGGATVLGRVLGGARFEVNSFHHQSARGVGRGLKVSAVSPMDGVVEGLERVDGGFGLAVQWHPEAFWNRSADFTPLFDALVAEAAR
jgi:putative glutamine amidotransferase